MVGINLEVAFTDIMVGVRNGEEKLKDSSGSQILQLFLKLLAGEGTRRVHYKDIPGFLVKLMEDIDKIGITKEVDENVVRVKHVLENGGDVTISLHLEKNTFNISFFYKGGSSFETIMRMITLAEQAGRPRG